MSASSPRISAAPRSATRSADPPRAEDVLWRHVLDAWFPRCLDREHGGYLCDFDRAWQAAGPQVKLLEFQARQTRVAALGARLRPGDPAWEAACRQGFRVLREVMWDAEHGGWYVLADRAGTPQQDGVKHGHGSAYAIQACLDVSRSIDEPEALPLARAGLDWMDAHAWDRRRGGYWGWMRRDGRPVGEDPSAAPAARDHLGVPAGAKDLNTNGDMLETLTEVQLRDAHGAGAERLAWLVARFDGWLAATGRLPPVLSPALEPIGTGVHPGYELQASWRLPLARAVLGEPLRVAPAERALLESVLASAGRGGAIRLADGHVEWWLQFEALRALALHAALDPGRADVLGAQGHTVLATIRSRFLDRRRGGIHPLARRLRLHRAAPKGNRWKDGSHEAMALAAVPRYGAARGRPLTLADDPWP